MGNALSSISRRSQSVCSYRNAEIIWKQQTYAHRLYPTKEKKLNRIWLEHSQPNYQLRMQSNLHMKTQSNIAERRRDLERNVTKLRVHSRAEEPEKKNGNGKKEPEVEDDSKLSLTQRFKKMWKQYWYVLVPVHAVTCSMWFGLFYAVSASGLDVVGFLEYIHVPDRIVEHIRNAPGAGHFVVAFALYKIVTPLRYMTTLGATYYAIKTLSRLGYIKPMPNRKQLKAMIDNGRDRFRQRRHRWRQERRFLMFRKRRNGHQHSRRKDDD